jgi:hypothetical protein
MNTASSFLLSRMNESIQYTGGNVGIGTSAPTSKLFINDSVNTEMGVKIRNTNSGSSAYSVLRLGNDTADAVIYLNSSSRTTDGGQHTLTIRNDTGNLRLQAKGSNNLLWLSTTGNIGIGTTSPTANFEVMGTMVTNHSSGIQQTGHLGPVIVDKSYTLTSGTFSGYGAYGLYKPTSTQIALTCPLNENGAEVCIGYYADNSTFTKAFHMDRFGDLFVNTNQITFSRFGSITANSSISAATLCAPNSTVTNIVMTNQTVGTSRVTTSLLSIGNSNTLGSVYTTGGNTGFGRIDPIATIDVAGDIGLYYGSSIRVGTGSNWPSGTTKLIETGWNINGMSGDCVSIYTPGSVSSTTRINLSSNGMINLNGNVGIGTNSPIARIHVVGNVSSTNGVVLLTGADTFGHTLYVASMESQKRVGISHNGTVGNIFTYNYGIGPQNLVLQYAGGNVGIGTSTPQQRLEVNSRIRIDGNNGVLELKTNSYISYLFTESTGDIKIYPASTSNKVLLQPSGGYVGIGTDSPSYPLHVVGNVGGEATWATSYYYHTSSNQGGVYIGWVPDQGAVYTVRSSHRMASAAFDVFSDVRIKKNIQDVDDVSALDTIRLIQPKLYNYIDEGLRGTERVWGFIAQQVKSVMNYAVNTSDEFVPDIFCLSTVGNLSNTSCTLTLPTPPNIIIDEKLRLIMENGCYKDVVVKTVDGNVLTVDCKIEQEKIFVYGKNVTDFHTLNKDAIFTVAVAALQEVDRELQTEKQEHTQTKQQLQILSSKMDSLIQKLNGKYPGEFEL